MSRIYVQDFYIEVHRQISEKDFFGSVIIYYSFDERNEDESIEHFSISVGTPDGIAAFLKLKLQDGSLSEIGLFSHLVVMGVYDQEKLLQYIKSKIESVYGKSREELVLKLLQDFDWEYSSNEQVMNDLFKRI